ncbi:hypothetical protein C8J57DRAFT_1323740 [Mycena rebaudengoi]|nr:hypothetical protein C8J57DRAFT_1323740 [Mycena rebaudengoi]
MLAGEEMERRDDMMQKGRLEDKRGLHSKSRNRSDEAGVCDEKIARGQGEGGELLLLGLLLRTLLLARLALVSIGARALHLLSSDMLHDMKGKRTHFGCESRVGRHEFLLLVRVNVGRLEYGAHVGVSGQGKLVVDGFCHAETIESLRDDVSSVLQGQHHSSRRCDVVGGLSPGCKIERRVKKQRKARRSEGRHVGLDFVEKRRLGEAEGSREYSGRS